MKDLKSSQEHGNVGSKFFLTFLLRFLSLIMQTVFPLYLLEIMKMPSYLIGLMISVWWIGNAIGAIVGAAFLTELKSAGLFGLVAVSFCYSSFSFFSYQPILILSMLIGGLGSGLLQPLLAPSLHTVSAPNTPFRGVSLYSTALSLALILGPLTSGLLISSSGFRFLFLILSILSLSCIAIPLLISENDERARYNIKSILGIFEIIRSDSFRREFLMNFIYSLTLPIILSFTGLLAKKVYNVDSASLLFLLSILFALSASIRFSMRNLLIKRVDRLMLIPCLLLLISSLMISNGSSQSLFFAGMLLFSIPHATIYPWTLYNVFQSSDRDKLVQLNYIFSLSSGIPEFISPPLVSYLIYMSGVLNAFYFLIFLSALAFAAALIFYRKDLPTL